MSSMSPNQGTQPAPSRPEDAPLRDDRTGNRTSDGRMPRQDEDRNLGDLLQELRILQQGSLVLTAFLIILPFNIGFSRLPASEHGVYLATFLCALGSLIFLSAPAAHHRLARPLHDRRTFKTIATRLALVGLGLFSIALVLATYLIVSTVLDAGMGIIVASLVGVSITVVWWVFPWVFLRQEGHHG